MNKKTLIIIALCALGLCIGETHAINTVFLTPIDKWEIANPPQGYEEINQQGTLMYGIGPNAVVAGANENSVYIGFNQSFGIVSIRIYNESGNIVYSTMVDTTVQQVVIIPFANAASGSYYVELSNAFGLADGDFERN